MDNSFPQQLIGFYFHSLDERGAPLWQGQVLSSPEPGIYLVQLFEWRSGFPSSMRLVRIDDMLGWNFYPTAEDWTDYYDRVLGPRVDRIMQELSFSPLTDEWLKTDTAHEVPDEGDR